MLPDFGYRASDLCGRPSTGRAVLATVQSTPPRRQRQARVAGIRRPRSPGTRLRNPAGAAPRHRVERSSVPPERLGTVCSMGRPRCAVPGGSHVPLMRITTGPATATAAASSAGHACWTAQNVMRRLACLDLPGSRLGPTQPWQRPSRRTLRRRRSPRALPLRSHAHRARCGRCPRSTERQIGTRCIAYGGWRLDTERHIAAPPRLLSGFPRW
jgi:hypothetical protein